MASRSHRSYSVRATGIYSKVIGQLFAYAESKKSNLVVSADLETMAELLALAEDLGPYMVVLKTHVDIITDFNHEDIIRLQNISAKHGFLIFEDRKFVDIGNTVQKQYAGGIYNIIDWAHLVNAVPLGGDGTVEGLKQVADKHPMERAMLLLPEMTSKGALNSAEYKKICLDSARKHERFVVGFVATKSMQNMPGEVDLSGAEFRGEDFVVFTTGINMADRGDSLGQQYQTPAEAVAGGADFIIAGRGIYKNSDPVATAKKYQQAGWNAYLKRIGED